MININITNGYQKALPLLNKRVASLKKIFGHAPKNITVTILPDREHMGSLIHRPLFSWEVAVTKNNTIFILDSTTSRHRHLTIQNFNTILHHELAHVFYNTIIPEGVPYWLNEGLACYLAHQKFKIYKDTRIPLRALKYYARFDPALYRYGPALTDLLIRKNSLRTLIKSLIIFSKTSHHPKEFNKIFKTLLKNPPRMFIHEGVPREAGCYL